MDQYEKQLSDFIRVIILRNKIAQLLLTKKWYAEYFRDNKLMIDKLHNLGLTLTLIVNNVDLWETNYWANFYKTLKSIPLINADNGVTLLKTLLASIVPDCDINYFNFVAIKEINFIYQNLIEHIHTIQMAIINKDKKND